MLRKTITYNDFNGEEWTEDFYFNLTKAELIELEVSHKDGLSESLKKIIAAEDGQAIMAQFKEIIRKAYGKRSPDGKRFLKSPEIFADFEASEAYSVLFVELVTNPEAASEFISAIMPQDLMKEQLKMEPEPEVAYLPPAEPREITRAEADAMDAAELQAGLASRTIRIAPPYQDPQALTKAEMLSMDIADLQGGLATGRYRAAE